MPCLDFRLLLRQILFNIQEEQDGNQGEACEYLQADKCEGKNPVDGIRLLHGYGKQSVCGRPDIFQSQLWVQPFAASLEAASAAEEAVNGAI